jgi:hypothetical protein
MPLTKIESGLLGANAVTSAAIANGEIVLADLAANSVGTSQLVTQSVTGNKIALGTITGNLIALNTITGDDIAPGTLTGNLLASTVTTTNLNFGGTSTFLNSMLESANVTTLLGANTTINVSQSLVVFTANANSNSTVNFVGLAGTPVGNTSTFVIIIPNGSSAKYISGYQIDGTAVTPKWQGGAPTSGTAANTDIYSISIIKTAATPTYNVFASVASYF